MRASGAFRVLRDSDLEMDEEAEDLVRYFRSAIQRRRRGRVIRLEFDSGTPPELEKGVRDALGADSALISESAGIIGVADLAQLVETDLPVLKFPPYTPRFPERIAEHDGDIFPAIRAKDFVIHHPYESFEAVVSFLRQAAEDPDVIAIKQTLYRAGKQSAIIDALVTAAEAGKSVTAVVELKARFDEEQNLLWANRLERAGVQVIYGFVEWKTHAKVSMVVRRESGSIRTYCHFGTGNYHPTTAKIYTDLELFHGVTPRRTRCGKLFNLTSGYVQPKGLELLTLSPNGMRDRILSLIDTEIANAKDGKPAAIWAKMNSLVDRQVIDALYSGQSGRCFDRPHRPRYLLPQARGRRLVEQHPGQIDRRTLPRTQPDFRLCQRRGAAASKGSGLHQFGRLDGPQFRPSRGIYDAVGKSHGACPGARPGDDREFDRQ